LRLPRELVTFASVWSQVKRPYGKKERTKLQEKKRNPERKEKKRPIDK